MSMTGPRAAAGRGGFTRSAGAAAGRGVLLIVFALAIGILLLARAIDGDSGGNVQTAGTEATGATSSTSAQTTAPPSESTTTTAALPPAHSPAQVPVLVLNGREIQGVARANNEALLRLGYNGLPPGNTAAAAPTSNVYFTDPAFQADAIKVAEALQIPAGKVVALGGTNLGVELKDAKVVIVLGQDNLGMQPG